LAIVIKLTAFVGTVHNVIVVGFPAKSVKRKPRYFCECVVYYK